MRNKIYFTILIVLIIILYLLRTFYFPDPKFLFIAGGIIVLYIWCKDVFTGVGWFEKKKPAAAVKAGDSFNQFTATAVAAPASINEKQGYLQLMHELVTPSLHPELAPFINDLKTFDGSNDEFAPLYSLSNFTDEAEIAFISILDHRSAIEDLVWRIETSLQQNYDTVIELPPPGQWPAQASVSYDNVFKTYNNSLKKYGFQLGFINTGGDDFALLVFKTVQKPRVEEAVKLTGYGYFEVID